VEKSSIMKSIYLAIAFWFFCSGLTSFGQTPGCTDPQATNFDSLANLNNGSCIYGAVGFLPSSPVNLPATLEEISGMVFWDGLFWGHNDSGNGPWIYAFDTLSGQVAKVVHLQGASNIDWEDMAQDEAHFYIGDFGNNANGNRTNLTIYKVPKALLVEAIDTIVIEKPQFDVIQYTYADQVSFNPTGANNTRFDCEAMFYHENTLHLITKNWVGDYAVHYTLPAVAGTHVAERQDSLFTGGFMITAADMGADDMVLLTAYNRTGSCAFFLIYGFGGINSLFDTGNKRRINLPSAFQIAQLEGVCFINGIRGAIGSERFRASVFDIPQNIRRFNTFQWVVDHYKRNSKTFAAEGMMRYNTELDAFEYFDGKQWVLLGGE
jgi:hypothetical protein